MTAIPTAPPVSAEQQPAPRAAPRIVEIDGLRGVAIALVMAYHVWLNRVSGGVDVFFVLSGFFITMTLLRSMEQHGRVGWTSYLSRLATRIVPPAMVTLLASVAATVVLLPQTRWRETLGDIVSAAFYVVNWRLAENAVDYFAARNAASPVQHFWSLAVQGQFYLAWPILAAIAALVATHLPIRRRSVLAAALAAVFVGSLGYSIQQTAADQAYTYFDTFARMWEFALGGLLLLALPYLRLRRRPAWLLSWAALAALVLCGLVSRAGSQFPGWVALWPTLSAAALVVTAASGHSVGAGRLLRAGWLRWLGELSYPLYLWHWPVLICYLAVVDRTIATVPGGLLVIVVSLLLAVGTRYLLERPLRVPRRHRPALALAAGSAVAVLAATGAWTGLIAYQSRAAAAELQADSAAYPGAAHLVHGGELPDVPFRPGPLEVGDDRPIDVYPGCHQDQRGSEALSCAYGPERPERTIVLVGGSRAQHWLPALEALVDKHRWRVITMTKSSCLFSAEPQTLRGQPYDSCTEWNQNVMRELVRLRPDAVFTTSTRVTQDREFTPAGYLQHWRALGAIGIEVLGVRDVPRWAQDVDVPECVEEYGPEARVCGNDPNVYGLNRPPALAQSADLPSNVVFLDLTRLFCEPDWCPAVVGNVLVYYDSSHITVTYARTLAPFLADAIRAATDW